LAAPQIKLAVADLKKYLDQMRGIHFDGTNILYADGHVKWLRLDKVDANSKYFWLKVKP